MKSTRLFSFALALGLTATIAAAQQAPVNLRSDSTFAILAGTTVTVTGGGTITGNIGIFPGTAYVAGVPAVTVNGTIYAGGPVAQQAQADLTLAYNDAAGRSLAPITISGNIGGQTLAPGLYKSTSSLAISSGDLTLDAGGNANAVWIFQIASTLTTTSGRKVILTGGANPANIFWQVGTSATIGTTSVFQGNILAGVSISLLTGSTLAGRALAIGGAVTLDTGGGSSTTLPVAPTAPTVTSTAPVNGAGGVPAGTKLTATFSTTMDASTINATTFTLKQGATPISGTVSYAGTTAMFTPNSNLAANLPYIATITTGATDTNGNALASNYSWTFTTGTSADTTPPTVISTAPASGASGVGMSNKLSASFSEPMDPSTISTSTFTLTQGATPISGAVSYSGVTAMFAPTALLSANTTYTATITTGAKDLAGNALVSNFVWNFTTGSAADVTPPTVVSTAPANGAVGVVTGNGVSAVFSEALDPLSTTTATFTLQQGATPVPGTVMYSGGTVTFTPQNALLANSQYTATITTGVKDLAGNALANPVIWTFTTGPAAAVSPVISAGGIVSAASYLPPVAPGSIASVFGSNLALGGASAAAITPLPTSLGGSSSKIGGLDTPLFYVSPTQMNVQIPWELSGQTQASMVTTVNGSTSTQQQVTIAPFAPGIFTVNEAGSGQGAVLISTTGRLATTGNPAARGSSVSIYATGLGLVSNQPVSGSAAGAIFSNALTVPTVTIGGIVATPSFAGLAPGYVGLYQVNVIVPASVTPGNFVPLSITVGNATSNTVTIAVQ